MRDPAAFPATTDPAAVHAMAPLGGYKGYGLGLVVEVLSAVLGGAGVASGDGGPRVPPKEATTPAAARGRDVPGGVLVAAA